jgi:hypothetical protein
MIASACGDIIIHASPPEWRDEHERARANLVRQQSLALISQFGLTRPTYRSFASPVLHIIGWRMRSMTL